MKVLYQSETAYKTTSTWQPLFQSESKAAADKAFVRIQAALANGPVVTSDEIWWMYTEKAAKARLVKRVDGNQDKHNQWNLVAAFEKH